MVEKMFQSSFVLCPHTLRLLLRGRAVQRRLKGLKPTDPCLLYPVSWQLTSITQVMFVVLLHTQARSSVSIHQLPQNS